MKIFCFSQPREETLFGAPNDKIISQYLDSKFYFVVKDTNEIMSLRNTYDSIQSRNGYKEVFYKIVFENLNEKEVNTVIGRIHFQWHISTVYFKNCTFKNMPNNLKELYNLSEIHFEECHNIENMNGFNSFSSVFALFFKNCRIKRLPDGIESFNPMLKLWLRFPDDYNQFNLNRELSRFETRKNILALYVRYKQLKDFPNNIFQQTSLNTLVFQSNESIKYPDNYETLPNIMHIFITSNKILYKDNFTKNKLCRIYYIFKYLDDEEYDMVNKNEDVVVVHSIDNYNYYEDRRKRNGNECGYDDYFIQIERNNRYGLDFYIKKERFIYFDKEWGEVNNSSKSFIFTFGEVKLRVSIDVSENNNLVISTIENPNKTIINILLKNEDDLFKIDSKNISEGEVKFNLDKYVTSPRYLELTDGINKTMIELVLKNK